MAKHNPANERIKRRYFAYLTGAHGRDQTTVDAVAKSLARFEDYTRAREFAKFRLEQAAGFRVKLSEERNARTGAQLSKATMLSTLRDLRAFFFWLADQPGFKSRIQHSDADYFSLSDKDVAIAQARREKVVPSVAQVEHTLRSMPVATVLVRRDRALIAFAAITGARVDALASFRLGHVNLAGGYVEHDARTVRTKFGKTFRTFFMPVCETALDIVTDWIGELERDHLWGPADPLFPATKMGLGEGGGFVAQGLARHGWATTSPIRDIFKRAFARADLPYFNPHSFRDMLVRHAMQMNLPTRTLKSWSQNLGHTDLLTTLTSYGNVPVHEQGELIRAVKSKDGNVSECEQIEVLEQILQELRRNSA